jgi:RHS repeat-associated protein
LDLGTLQSSYFKDAKPITQRGFTGHEMLDEVGVIHMNGRIYDAKLGRFMQADPIIQEPTSIGSLNRYSYCANNPLNATDPSGFISLKHLYKNVMKWTGSWAIHKLVHSISPNLAAFIGVALNFIPGIGQGLSLMWTFQDTFYTTGSLTAAIKGYAIASFSQGAFSSIGGAFNAASGVWQAGGMAHILAHATTGGVISVLQGGKFGHGFVSAGLTKAINVNGIYGVDQGIGHTIARTAMAAVIGGTISQITGGKFANGAVTAATAQIFNAESQAKAAAQKRQALVTAAQKHFGETTWAKDAEKESFKSGQWKCNLFVADVLKEAGITPQMMQPGSKEFMNANGWASKYEMKGWVIVDTPEPGDIAAVPRSGRSGHVGVYIGNGKVIAANEYSVGVSSTHAANDGWFGHWRTNSSGDTVYRRYVGP